MTIGIRPGDRSAGGAADRRFMLWAIARVVLTGVALVTFYFLLPYDQVTALETVLRLVGGVVLVVVAVGWQVRSIIQSPRPQLRAIEAVGLSFWMLVIVFAIVYVSLSRVYPASFSEPLSEVAGLYFTMSVFATVGFGDIVAVTDVARMVVTVHMLLNLLLLGVVVKILWGVGQTAAASRIKV